jgi:hypothetical protein
MLCSKAAISAPSAPARSDLTCLVISSDWWYLLLGDTLWYYHRRIVEKYVVPIVVLRARRAKNHDIAVTPGIIVIQRNIFYLSILISALEIVSCIKDVPRTSRTDAGSAAKQGTDSKTNSPTPSKANIGRTTDSGKSFPTATRISVSYKVGAIIDPPIIYAIWLEDAAKTSIQNLYICARLLNNSLTNTALPYWSMNKLPISSRTEVDAVTGATFQKQDFSIEATVKAASIRKLVVYVEMDHSFDANDWFDNQPALLFAADVDLDSGKKAYTLSPIGWTANEGTAGVIQGAGAGSLQKEMRYITHHKADNGGFGQPDERASTKMVGSLTVTIL